MQRRSPSSAQYYQSMRVVGSALASYHRLADAQKLFERVVKESQQPSEWALASFNLFPVQVQQPDYPKALAHLNEAMRWDKAWYALHGVEKYPIGKILGAGGMRVFVLRPRQRFDSRRW